MSIAARAALAVVLMVGFYLLALAIAAGLLFIPYAEWAYADRIHIKLALICVIGAGVILWAILPRIDRFDPPWPRLLPEEHPRLFAQIRGVAEASGQAMPVEVYLDPDLNAWVAQRGGVMGVGSRRVMGIGLPLLAVAKASHLRAVLAHEFGHFHGGDTKLGPWIYKTRGAIIRTVNSLAEGGHSILYLPFLGYGKLFLRITNAVSRRQELSADALAARVAGRDAARDVLRLIHGSALAFQPYLESELEPVLNSGYRPPIAEGFVRFLGSGSVKAAVDNAVSEEMREAQKDPYDTHPPLRERLDALERLPAGPPAANDDPPALSLLDRIPDMESRLLSALSGAAAQALKPVDWDRVGPQVYIPMWTEAVGKHRSVLQGLTPAGLPDATVDLPRMGRRLGAGDAATKDEAVGRGISMLGAALALALHRVGWTILADPGAPVSLRKGDADIEPFRVIEELGQKKLDPDAWRVRCAGLGIADLDLASAPPAGEAGGAESTTVG